MQTVFMDLQGTLGGDPVGDITSFEFYPGVVEGLKILKEQGFRLIVVTNQSKISKGKLSYETYEGKRHEIIAELDSHGIGQIEFYCCPHSHEDLCHCKKPKTGLFEQANAIKPIDKSKCFMIGDMGATDMMFAHNLGIEKILVLTGVGNGSLDAFRSAWCETEAEFIANDFYEAAVWVKHRFHITTHTDDSKTRAGILLK